MHKLKKFAIHLVDLYVCLLGVKAVTKLPDATLLALTETEYSSTSVFLFKIK
jgi:hypothetical protein